MKGIFYATSTGNTEEIANKVKEKLPDYELIDISVNGISKMQDCESLIIGVSTWGDGDLSDDWEDCFEDLKEINFSGKKLAIFGLGDQDGYDDTFADAMGIIYEVVNENGATIYGQTSTQGYTYDESKAEINDEFVGLVIDEDNQEELTDSRIEQWCKQISNM